MEVQWELPSDPLLTVSTGFQRTERLQGECGRVEDVDAGHGPVLVTSGLYLTFWCLRASQGEKGKRGIDGVDGMKVILRQEGWEGGVCYLGWEVDKARGCPKCGYSSHNGLSWETWRCESGDVSYQNPGPSKFQAIHLISEGSQLSWEGLG